MSSKVLDSLKILLVEDDEDARFVTQMALRRVGGAVVEAAGSACDALEVLERFQPELMLLDVSLPGIDGPTFLQSLREERGVVIPAIFLTAHTASEAQQRYLDAGALGIIHKPFDPRTLPMQIRSIYQ